MFLKLIAVLSEIHLVLTASREHGKVFQKVPTMRFKRAKRLKDILVTRAKLAPLEKKKGCCRSCEGTTCEICKHVTTKTFRSFSTQGEYCIIKTNSMNCHSAAFKILVLSTSAIKCRHNFKIFRFFTLTNKSAKDSAETFVYYLTMALTYLSILPRAMILVLNS